MFAFLFASMKADFSLQLAKDEPLSRSSPTFRTASPVRVPSVKLIKEMSMDIL
jgi:hypothetical protein